MVLELLGAVVVIATIWAALQLEGIPSCDCAGEGSAPDTGIGIPLPPAAGTRVSARSSSFLRPAEVKQRSA